jgi:flagellar export protein FliJ
MKFKFSYAKLEEYHKQQEEIAQRDYIESLNRLEEEKKTLRKMYEENDRSLQISYEIREGKRPFSQATLTAIEVFIDGSDKKIDVQRAVVMSHNTICENKQEILIAAAREHKTFQKLREKQYAEFKTAMKKKEMKINDELVVTRFKRSDVA